MEFVVTGDIIGLIAINSNGHVFYWENISIGVESYKLLLPFSNGECLQLLRQISSSSFLLATSLQVYKITFRESAVLEIVTLVKPKPLLSLLFSVSQTVKDPTVSILPLNDARYTLI